MLSGTRLFLSPRCCTDACRGTAAGTVFAQTAFHHAQNDTQDGALRGRITAQEIAPLLGYSQHPLAHRQAWKDVIGQMRSRRDPGWRRRSGVCSCASDGSRADDERDCASFNNLARMFGHYSNMSPVVSGYRANNNNWLHPAPSGIVLGNSARAL